MSEVLIDRAAPPAASFDGVAPATLPLGRMKRNRRGVILKVDGELAGAGVLDAQELERRLLELGFVEGARVEILHQGLFFRDPIAVKLDDMRVALRRREARAIEVQLD